MINHEDLPDFAAIKAELVEAFPASSDALIAGLLATFAEFAASVDPGDIEPHVSPGWLLRYVKRDPGVAVIETNRHLALWKQHQA